MLASVEEADGGRGEGGAEGQKVTECWEGGIARDGEGNS